MKIIVNAILLILWMAISLVLVCTIIGLVLFMPDDEPSAWQRIGDNLSKNLSL